MNSYVYGLHMGTTDSEIQLAAHMQGEFPEVARRLRVISTKYEHL